MSGLVVAVAMQVAPFLHLAFSHGSCSPMLSSWALRLLAHPGLTLCRTLAACRKSDSLSLMVTCLMHPLKLVALRRCHLFRDFSPTRSGTPAMYRGDLVVRNSLDPSLMIDLEK